MTQLARLVLVWMVALQDPNSWGVTPDWAASYPATAQEIADTAEARPLDGSADLMARVLTVQAFRESRFHGIPCTARWDCDHGASVGKWQTWRGWGPPTAETAAKLVQRSWSVCRHRPKEERLGWYARGGTGCDERLELSRSRMREVEKLGSLRAP